MVEYTHDFGGIQPDRQNGGMKNQGISSVGKFELCTIALLYKSMSLNNLIGLRLLNLDPSNSAYISKDALHASSLSIHLK